MSSAMSKESIIRLIDPYNDRPNLVNYDIHELLEILNNILQARVMFKPDDYEVSKTVFSSHLYSKGDKLRKLAKKYEKEEEQLKIRERIIRQRAESVKREESKTPVARAISDERDRPPIPSRTECLIPPENRSLDDVLYYSSFDENLEEKHLNEAINNSKRHQISFKTEEEKEEEDFRIALEESLKTINSQIEKETLDILKEEVPDYESLKNKYSGFTKEIADTIFSHLKDMNIDGYKKYISTLDVSISSVMNNLSYNGNTFKQMFFRKDPSIYKCMM